LPALVFGALTLFIAIGSGDSPWYPFAARRALPVTLPLAVLMWGSLIAGAIRKRTVLAGLLVILPVLPALWRQHEAVTVRPGTGFRATRDALAEAVPAGRTVLAFGETRRYAAHLALLDDRQVVTVDDGARRELRALRGLASGSSDLLLLTDEWRDGGRLAEVEERRTGLEVVRSPPLRAAEPANRRFLLVEPSRAERRLTARLDVGRDDLLRIAGGYRPEAAGDRATRWTGPRAWILMPSGDAVRFVWSAGGHPDAPVPVDVLVNGRPVARARVPGPWSTSPWIGLPEGPSQQIIELRVPTFSPIRQDASGSDGRRLGIRLDRVEVHRSGG
jgi:hypothetical protein